MAAAAPRIRARGLWAKAAAPPVLWGGELPVVVVEPEAVGRPEVEVDRVGTEMVELPPVGAALVEAEPVERVMDPEEADEAVEAELEEEAAEETGAVAPRTENWPL